MNRASRRKITQQSLSHTDLKILLHNEGLRVRKEAVRNYSTAVALVLRDKLGYGKVRIHRTLQHIVDIFDSINRGDLNLIDIEKTLKEECDVEIR